jgi:hypothetical protein
MVRGDEDCSTKTSDSSLCGYLDCDLVGWAALVHVAWIFVLVAVELLVRRTDYRMV